MLTRFRRCSFALALAALVGCGGSTGGEALGSPPTSGTVLPSDAVAYFPTASNVPNAPTSCPVSTPATMLTCRPELKFKRARLGSK